MVDEALPEIQPRKILAGQFYPQEMAFVIHFLSTVGAMRWSVRGAVSV